MLAILMLILVFLLAFSGTPLFVIMGLGALLGFALISEVDIAIVIQEAYRLASAPALIAIPLFTLAGYILAESKAPERMLRFTRAVIGWLPGGVALVVLIATAIFTALTGASGITIIALGGLLMPLLMKAGYPEKFSIGLVTSTGSIGLLFPPSLPIILFGIISQTSVNELFIAGILPGMLIIFVFFLYSFFMSVRFRAFSPEKVSFKEVVDATRSAIFEIPLPLFIIGGIYTGIFTASEAASITVIWVIIAEFLIYRDIKISDFPKIAKESMILVGSIFAILSMAMGFTNFLVDQQIPQKLFEIAQQYIKSQFSFFIILNLFLLIVGMLMDIFSAIVVVVPLIAPVALKYGVDPVHLGIIFLTNLEIGYLTPPVGMNLFISSFRFGKPITYLYRIVIPFISLLLICLIMITYIPRISLFFVRAVVEGRVVDAETGKPVSEAIVKIPELKKEVKVDEEGNFKLYLPLPDFSKPHNYFIMFQAEGFDPHFEKVKVRRMQTLEIEVKLKKKNEELLEEEQNSEGSLQQKKEITSVKLNLR